MRQEGATIGTAKRILSCLLAVWLLFAGLYAGELRVSSAQFQAAAGQQDAVYRLIPDVLFSDEACTETMIGGRVRMPELRAFRPARKLLRARLTELTLHAVMPHAVQRFFARQNVFAVPKLAQGLLITIQYIHDLDGEKSIQY